jgi:hypothetical protein
MVRITQDKNSTNYPLSEIKKLCSAKEYVDISIPDIISSSELSAKEGEEAIIEGDESIEYIKYEKDKPKGAFSLFFDEDNSGESYESEGGQPLSEESEESISSESESNEKPKYGKVNIPSGISTEQSIQSELESIELLPSIDKSSKSEKVISPSEESVVSEKIISPSEESVVSEKVISPSEESVVSEKVISPSEESVVSEKIISPSEESVISEKVISPSEESVVSEKVISPSEESIVSEKIISPSEESIVSVISDEPLPILSPIKSVLSEETKKEVEEESDREVDEESDREVDEESDREIRNIDGMKLNKPYYFQTLIEKKDPILILKEDTKEYNAYSRTCLSDKRRQPVILTDSQLEKINKDNPGFLREQDVLRYGSDKKHQFNYICPRYWCLKSNTFIDPNDIKNVNGELVHTPKKGPSCGKVLPKKEKKVKPGYYIYEFNDESYPGLIPDKHPKGLCLPCCFKNYNTEGRIKAKQSCLEKENKQEQDVVKEDKKEKDDNYVLGPDKFPLDLGRWGYLPGEIQTILHEVSADCQISKTNTNVKENHPCLLRHGVEINKKQSFIAAISDEIFFAKRIIDEENKLKTKEAKVLSIKEMRERIITSINIDSFIKYQNGNLVNDFYDPNTSVDIKKYQNTKLYSKLDLKKNEENSYFKKVVSSFENFILFLKDDNVIIDHTYLWDIISMPNKYLFPNGVNLIIFQLPHDDITNNVQLLCPTNHYSSEFYEARKPSIFLIKEDGYYEPIYSYLTDPKKTTITKEFKERDTQLSKTMKAVFKQLIKPFFELICRPLESMPNEYKIGKSPNIFKAKRPLLLYDLVQKLDKYEYNIKKLVMNFNNKIIGVLSEEPNGSERSCFIPCYPSALDENLKKDLDYVFMNDETLWRPYTETVQFLNKLTSKTKKRRDEPVIPCKPEFKIVEDEMVVGILTNTNQFIQISEPIHVYEIDPDLDLPSITDQDYIVNPKERQMIQSDTQITTQNIVDVEREDYIKKIKLETSFYNVFRNTIRILLNNYENIKIRGQIESEMLKEYIIYSDKLLNIKKLLIELVDDKIQFIGDKNYYKVIDEVTTCIVKDNDTCKDTPNLCVVTENGKCNLILPERNLITYKQNKYIYFGRMADELIRYNRIKNFMLQPQTYLSFGNIGYNLKDNEIILIQSILTPEYFEKLIPAITNKYVKYNSYDETQPIITQLYDNKIDQSIGIKNELVCDKIDKSHITSGIWKKCFPESFIETEYSKYNFCTFNFIIDLIERKTKEKFTINDIKNQLYDEYKKYLEKYKDKIVDILIIEGKKTLGDQVQHGTLSFDNFIYSDNYFLTTLDLWLLINRFKIPTIFITSTTILQTRYQENGKYLYNSQFIAYGYRENDFAFIILPGFSPEKVPNFKIIKNEKGDVFIPLYQLSDECRENVADAFSSKISVEDYLEQFRMAPKTMYEKKKKKGLIIETEVRKKETIEQTREEEKKIIKPSRKNQVRGEPKNKTRRPIKT